jgi:hypothetical protein
MYNVNKLLAQRGISEPEVSTEATPPAQAPAPTQPPQSSHIVSSDQYTPELKEAAIKKYEETKNFSETALALGIKDIFAVVRWVKENEMTNAS